MTTPYVYVFVRTDIPLADQLVQTGHVCIDAGKAFGHPEGTHLVLCGLRDSGELEKLEKKLNKKMINYIKFWEPDDEMGYTAVATEVIYGKTREAFAKYSLWS